MPIKSYALRRLLCEGKPFLGANVQADKTPDICFCKFQGVGVRLSSFHCDVHVDASYPCDICNCPDYRPASIKLAPAHHPLCVCGHIAQDHN